MNSVIWKIDLEPGDVAYSLPRGAQLLHAAFQRGLPQLWFRCDPSQPLEQRRVLFIGTGHPFEDDNPFRPFRHVATMLTKDESLVFHILERAP